MHSIYNRRRPNITFVLFAALIVLGYLFVPGFNRAGMYFSIMTQASVTGILALGMLYVLLCGDIDLSIPSQTAFYGIICVNLSTLMPLPVAALITFVTAVSYGALSCYLMVRLRINTIIASIAAGALLSALTYIIANGLPVFNIPTALEDMASLRLWRFSFASLLFLTLAAATAALLAFTYWGKYFYAVGIDRQEAERAGINVGVTRMRASALCSLFCAIASILQIGRIGLASVDVASNDILQVLSIAAFGGVSFSGGKGRVLPLVCACLFLSALSAVFLALRIPSYWATFINAAILLLAVFTKFEKT